MLAEGQAPAQPEGLVITHATLGKDGLERE
jgi:hypothetical protein